jgi:peptide/nickel transport system substrate-binding protein
MAGGIRRFGVRPAVAACVALLGGITPIGSAAAQQSPLVRIAITQNDKNWTPYTYQTGDPGYNVLTLLYDTLLWHDKDNNLIPWLAKDYKISADGRTVDVTLRDNVKWSDGQAMTADDVKFTYDYILEFNHGRFSPEVNGVLASTVVNGPDKVSFNLKTPFAPFLTAPLADVPIMPKHVWENIREVYPSVKGEQGLAIGTGPYKMVEYTPDKQYRLVANPDYFMGKPAAAEIDLQIIPDSTAQVLALRAGEVDAMAANLAPELVKELATAPGLNVLTGPGYTSSALTFNVTRPPFDSVRFRQAVANAIDVDGLVAQVLQGVGVAGSPGYVHPDNPFYKKGLRHEFNLVKANATLDEIGYRNKDSDGIRKSDAGKRLEFEILASSASPIEVRTAEVVGTMLAKAGIKTSVTALTGAAKAARTGGFGGQTPDRDFDMQMTGLTAPAQDDPDRLRTALETWTPAAPNLNSGKWSNPQFDAALQAESTELDPVKRMAVINQMQDIIANDRPNVVLYYRNGGYGVRPAAYANWVYVRGKGIVDKVSFVAPQSPSGTNPTAAAPSTSKSGGSGRGAVVAVVVVLALVAGGALTLRARGRRVEKE